jgi:hypothetical protein
MAGAKHARTFRKRFDDSFDDLVLVDHVVLLCDAELVTTHESDLKPCKERPFSGERWARTAPTRPLKGAPATNLLRSRRIHTM